MLKYLLDKFGLIYSTFLSVGMSIIVSIGITTTAMSMMGLGQQNWKFGIAVAILCPLIIATPAAYFLLRLIDQLNKHKQELQESYQKLEIALKEVKELSGLLPICAACKKIRDDTGYWHQIEAYIRDHSEANFTHSICPGCMKKLYPEQGL
jgi:hypothetical protein